MWFFDDIGNAMLKQRSKLKNDKVTGTSVTDIVTSIPKLYKKYKWNVSPTFITQSMQKYVKYAVLPMAQPISTMM
uniref:Transposase n=1 Tax=Panagrellus redivivus TaxID=6233 RepID=A0A7E5A294_PANRE